MKLTAISSRRRRSEASGTVGEDFVEVLGLFNDAAAREVSLEDAG